MFCKNCGSNLKDGSTFCHNCGSLVNDYVVSAQQVTPETENMPESVPMQSQVPIQNSQPAPFIQQPVKTPNAVYPAPTVQQPASNMPLQNVQAHTNVPPVYTAPVNPQVLGNAPTVQPQVPQQYGYTPYPYVQEPKKSGGAFPVLSLIFGIIGLALDFIGILFAPAALIFGIIGRKKGKSGMALAGIILGSVGTAVSIIAISSLIFNGESLLDSFLYDGGLYF